MEDACDVMEDLTDVGPAFDEVGAGLVDVRDRELQALVRAGRGGGDPRAKDDGTAGTGRCELHDPVVLFLCEVGVEPPAQGLVEGLRPVHIRDRDDHDLQLELSGLHRLAAHCGLRSLEPPTRDNDGGKASWLTLRSSFVVRLKSRTGIRFTFPPGWAKVKVLSWEARGRSRPPPVTAWRGRRPAGAHRGRRSFSR